MYGSPSPSSGWFDSGSSINEFVTSPVSGGSGVQYVCTGWTGTGSVPASGTASSVTFAMSANSTITWNWKTQYYLTVASAYDSPSPVSGWFDLGSNVTESVASPVSGGSGFQFVCTGWSGSGSAPSSGSGTLTSFTMTQASAITWDWMTQYYLTVSSPYDSPSPSSGWFDSGSSINESVTSPASAGSAVQYLCTGWSGSGSITGSGSGLSVSFTMTQSSTITWGWGTEYQVTLGESGVGSAFSGTVVTVDGVNYAASGLPVSFWWNSGSSHSFSFVSQLTSGSNQCLWGSTSGLSTLQSGKVTIIASGNVVGN
jgi:hypothetical protein